MVMSDRQKGPRMPSILYSFPAETVIAGGLILTGLLVLGYPGSGFYNPPWPWFNVPFAWLLIVSGSLTLIGVSTYRITWQAGIEQLGLWLTATATAVYSLIIALTGPRTAVFTVITFACCAAISALRAMAIRFDQVRYLHELSHPPNAGIEEITAELRKEVAKHERDGRREHPSAD